MSSFITKITEEKIPKNINAISELKRKLSSGQINI